MSACIYKRLVLQRNLENLTSSGLSITIHQALDYRTAEEVYYGGKMLTMNNKLVCKIRVQLSKSVFISTRDPF